jgi:hypothetical protein
MRRQNRVRLLLGLVLGVGGLSAAGMGTTGVAPSHSTGALTHRHGAHAESGAPAGITLAVDGASHPERVSDDHAWALFLSAMARTDANTREVALTKVGFDAADRAAFGGALGSLPGELAALAERRKTGARPDHLLQEQARAVHNARVRVAQALSPDGRRQLDAYVGTEVKRRTRIYRGPMTGSQGGAR